MGSAPLGADRRMAGDYALDADPWWGRINATGVILHSSIRPRRMAQPQVVDPLLMETVHPTSTRDATHLPATRGTVASCKHSTRAVSTCESSSQAQQVAPVPGRRWHQDPCAPLDRDQTPSQRHLTAPGLMHTPQPATNSTSQVKYRSWYLTRATEQAHPLPGGNRYDHLVRVGGLIHQPSPPRLTLSTPLPELGFWRTPR